MWKVYKIEENNMFPSNSLIIMKGRIDKFSIGKLKVIKELNTRQRIISYLDFNFINVEWLKCLDIKFNNATHE